jgi:predicted nucleotidyltransferase component of viral defense system
MNEEKLRHTIRSVAAESGTTVHACWLQLLRERFLARLAASIHAEHFVFKGGQCLAHYLPIHRETTDVDFLLTRMKIDAIAIEEAVRQIAAVKMSDGINFTVYSVESLIQPHMEYVGYRVRVRGAFGRREEMLQVDIGVGDRVKPVPCRIQPIRHRGQPVLGDGSDILLLRYPVESIFAEKLETILAKGGGNSRMKDYHDLILLVRDSDLLNVEQLWEALVSTFGTRGAVIRPIEFSSSDLTELQRYWAAHIRTLGDAIHELALPAEISSVIEEINLFVEPIINLVTTN